MALMTGDEYLKSLEKLHPTTYILGEKVANPFNHPLIKPMIMGVARTYDLEHDPEGAKLLVTQNERGEQVSRFVKLYRNTDDLIAKVRMLKFLSHKIGTCFMRCTGMDGMNAVGTQIYDCDQKYGTEYWPRLLSLIDMLQAGDLTLFSGVTDVKGNRALRPSQQKDPDMYLHVVSKDSKGIVVRGERYTRPARCARTGGW
jgi:4-hydroxybutyryl-CoA dehydratase/vinylacetyl-CoA-Delta-isomerase